MSERGIIGRIGKREGPLCERRAFSLIFTSIEYIFVVRLAAAEAIDLARNAPKVGLLIGKRIAKGGLRSEELAFCKWTEDLVKETSLNNKELIERNALGSLLAEEWNLLERKKRN